MWRISSLPLSRLIGLRPVTVNTTLSRCFHTKSNSVNQGNRNKWMNAERLNDDKFKDYWSNIKQNDVYKNLSESIVYILCRDAYMQGNHDAGGSTSGTLKAGAVKALAKLVLFIGMGYLLYKWMDQINVFPGGGTASTSSPEYLVEASTKDFKDVRGMPEILDEFEQVVDLIRNKDRYTAMGAKLPGGILLNGPPGTGKTLIAKAIAGEAGVPFLYASGSQFDEMFVGVGASRMRKLFKEAREQSPCIIFIDEIDAVAGKRSNSGEGTPSYARMTINQLLQEMDGLKENENIIVLGATNLKNVIDPALLRPGRFDLIIDVPTPDKKGREEILEHYFAKVKHDSSINIKRIADVTAGFTGASLANIVNQAAIKAVNEGHKKVDLSHLEFAFDKITMGPELKSMKQNIAGERKTAIHEGGHCLIAYLLHKNGEYDYRPRKATVTRRGGALGHVSFMSDDKSDESSASLQHLRAHLVVGMGGRAAEAIFHGETKVCTGASSDMQQAFKIAQQIVCTASAGEQIKGRMIDLKSASETKKAEVDKLIDTEIDIAYKRAVQLLKKESNLHNLLIEAMVKFRTLDADEIDLLLTKKSLKAVQAMREENERNRKTEIEKKESSIIKKLIGNPEK